MTLELTNNRLAHISDITAEYQTLQLDVIEKHRRWHKNQTHQNLTDLVNAQDKLGAAPYQEYLPGMEDIEGQRLVNAIHVRHGLAPLEPCS